jgi:hypothetical protein
MLGVNLTNPTMTFNEYLGITERNKFFILISILICGLTGALLGFQKNTLYNSSLFITFSVKSSQSSSEENLQSSDQITETIQGWFKDPAFLKNKETDSIYQINANAKKQEKNNLLISYDSIDQKTAEDKSTIILDLLQNRLSEYNKNSDLKVNIALSSNTHLQSTNPIFSYSIIGLLIGLISGLALSLLYEIKHQKIISLIQIESEKILKSSNPAIVQSIIKEYSKLQFIKLFPGKIKQNKLEILGTKEKDILNLENLDKLENLNSIILIKLGESKHTDLESLKLIINKELIIFPV